MEEVVFQNAASGSSPAMFRVKRLEGKILLLPLLSKEIQITRLVLLEPEVLIENDKSGKWNVEFDKPGGDPRKDPSPQGFALRKLGFHQVQVEKGIVSYRDGENKGIARTLKGVGESVKKVFSGQRPQPMSDSLSDVYRGGRP